METTVQEGLRRNYAGFKIGLRGRVYFSHVANQGEWEAEKGGIYTLYLLSNRVAWVSPSGISQHPLAPEVSAGTTSIEVPVDFPLGNFTHFAIFTRSAVAPGPQTTGTPNS